MSKSRHIPPPPVHARPQAPEAVAAKLDRAIALHQQGQLSQAERLYEKILQKQPRQFDALHLLGVIALQKGDTRRGIHLIGRAVEADPGQASAHFNLGKALQSRKQHEEALASYDRALALDPGYADALVNRGNALLELGRPDEALASFDRALLLRPDSAEALINRGNALGELKRYDEALASYDGALAARPDFVQALNNRGTTLRDLKRHEEALASFERALTLLPGFAEAHNNRGTALQDLKRPEEALSSFDRAIALRPGYIEAMINRANTLVDLNRGEEAIECCDRALALQPDHAQAYFNRGNALRDLKRPEDALAEFDRAIALKPGHVEALYNRGATLLELRRHEDAAASYARVVEIDPEHEYAQGNLFRARQMGCDWSQYERNAQRIAEAVAQGKRLISPFSFLAVSASASAQLRCARTYAEDWSPPSPDPLWAGEVYRHNRIRVAYLSADFREHAVSILMAGLFERHDRERFETIAVSLRPEDPSALGQRVKAAFDRFLDVSRRSGREIAAMMREMEVDIAVDLMGYTSDSRRAILSHRCAPVQVNYLGYPGTMGAQYIDCIIADDFLIPGELRGDYSESVVILPDCFQSNDDRRTTGSDTPGRIEAGLPESGFAFCSFNNSYKINPAMFDVWMRLLDSAPGSVLWLLADNPCVPGNLRAQARNRGVDPDRLIFTPRVPYADYLARLRLADLYLDTLPFNAGTTASDALWAGVPVLTCAGEAMASRMAGSLLHAAGLPELVTYRLEDYEKRAADLAAAPEALAEIRAKLARNRATCPLFDTDRFRRHIESAYTTMWERSQRGEPPAGFSVEAIRA